MNGDPLEQLRDKLKGKMEVAKFFAGFISVVFGFLLKEGLGISKQSDHVVAIIGAYAAILLFIASLTFSIATVFAYDRLLMPTMFWRNPPDPFALRREMVTAWQWLFVPAVGSLVVGLLAATVAVTDAFGISFAVWVIPVGIASFAYRCFSKRLQFVD